MTEKDFECCETEMSAYGFAQAIHIGKLNRLGLVNAIEQEFITGLSKLKQHFPEDPMEDMGTFSFTMEPSDIGPGFFKLHMKLVVSEPPERPDVSNVMKETRDA